MTNRNAEQTNRAATLPFKRQDQLESVPDFTSPPSPQSSASTEHTVRRMHPTDLRLLGSRIEAAYLDQPWSLVDRSGLFTTGARSLRPLDRDRPVTHIAFAPDNEFAGVIQFDQTTIDPRWTATALGVTDAATDQNRLVTDLLEFSIRRAGSRGIKRLFARLPAESLIEEQFRRSGFELFTCETIVSVPAVTGLALLSGRVREQEQTDTWAVHQLYHACVPRDVQFAEAWTSHRWDPTVGRRIRPDTTSWVLEDGRQLVAWARAVSGNRTAVIEAMYLGDRHECGIELMRDVIRRLSQSPDGGRMFVAVRAYQAELLGELVALGGSILGDQRMAVRYTAAKVASKAVDSSIQVNVEVRKRVPRRVPSYMKRPRNDEAAP